MSTNDVIVNARSLFDIIGQARSQGGAKGAYASPPFARDACRSPSTQPASACARGRTRDSHAFFFSAHA